MSKLIRPVQLGRKNLMDSRSTGGATPIRVADIAALRGTLKDRS
jgi:hypothetical protein